MTAHNTVDENIWLEDIHGEEPLAWVREQNARTEDVLDDDEFQALQGRLLEVLDSTDRIPMVGKRGTWYYNFWRDSAHPKGLWRRTSWESYLTAAPEWDVLLDVDELAAAEGREWVWHGATFLRPGPGGEWRHAMIGLSPDGGDAASYREFDLQTREFVPDGFALPTAKGHVSWEDADTLLVSTTAEGRPATQSSYPRTGVRWRRGTPLSEAEQLFEVPEEHMLASVSYDPTPGFERLAAVDYVDFFNDEVFLWWNGAWTALEKPGTVNASWHHEWLLFRPRDPWTVEGVEYPAGSLLTGRLDDWLGGSRDLTVLFAPDARTALQSYSWTRNHLLLNLLVDVSSQIHVLTPGVSADGSPDWSSEELDACPPLHDVNAYAVDDEDDDAADDYWLVATGFLTPTTVTRGTLGGDHTEVKRAPSFFTEDDYRVEQHFATSADGTRVPYFQVSRRDLVLDSGNVTLLSGYGGFEVSRTPAYSGTVGRAWLERGGVYVVANIRGGGEYGPSWHTAALQEKRHRAYEDFAAVAKDLVARDVTSPKLLGCAGGSNGGLLVGNMLTQYPELFGAVSCGVPLLDMRRYTRLSAGASWIAEYGDPDDPEQWEFIRTFSPYHLLKDGVDYPHSFIWSSTSDDRVGPVQARKMAARMQAMGVPNVWYHETIEGGHAGASDNRQAAGLQARNHHFLWKALTGQLPG
ncbi:MULTISPECIES: prolyl oligopeptidase family serine peptidase [Arthrobacter]|uniref:Prolyl oligopeptidase family serine peptidase n=2 Tax=Arthrobacter TaxID=1663 RepID=A0ABU9KHG3_9MICC|nr:prolyl oligopeptidase family serine peptidase [Arthrobacter sp. YJM1]MDP5226668.1 prolyl oligopeptidase family serine peptidase [Arthrobacter sp. YJM1]